MNNAHPFPCPNCGNYGTRRHYISKEAIHSSCPNQQVMTTECSICDYLMTMCSLDGRVIESSSLPFAIANASDSRIDKANDTKIFSTPVKLSASNQKLAIKQKMVTLKSQISA